MRLLLVGLAATLIAAPAMAQKFVSVTGENTRTTIGAIAAEEAPAPETADAADARTSDPEAEGTEIAEAELDEDMEGLDVLAEPEVIEFADPIDRFAPNPYECNSGSVWNPTSNQCETF